MVLIGCCSFACKINLGHTSDSTNHNPTNPTSLFLAANKVGNMYIFDSGDVVSALGATVVGILGSIYGHWSPGDALPSMMPGILVLLPVSSNGFCDPPH